MKGLWMVKKGLGNLYIMGKEKQEKHNKGKRCLKG
jgi:hypothetical protein